MVNSKENSLGRNIFLCLQLRLLCNKWQMEIIFMLLIDYLTPKFKSLDELSFNWLCQRKDMLRWRQFWRKLRRRIVPGHVNMLKSAERLPGLVFFLWEVPAQSIRVSENQVPITQSFKGRTFSTSLCRLYWVNWAEIISRHCICIVDWWTW